MLLDLAAALRPRASPCRAAPRAPGRASCCTTAVGVVGAAPRRAGARASAQRRERQQADRAAPHATRSAPSAPRGARAPSSTLVEVVVRDASARRLLAASSRRTAPAPSICALAALEVRVAHEEVVVERGLARAVDRRHRDRAPVHPGDRRARSSASGSGSRRRCSRPCRGGSRARAAGSSSTARSGMPQTASIWPGVLVVERHVEEAASRRPRGRRRRASSSPRSGASRCPASRRPPLAEAAHGADRVAHVQERVVEAGAQDARREEAPELAERLEGDAVEPVVEREEQPVLASRTGPGPRSRRGPAAASGSRARAALRRERQRALHSSFSLSSDRRGSGSAVRSCRSSTNASCLNCISSPGPRNSLLAARRELDVLVAEQARREDRRPRCRSGARASRSTSSTDPRAQLVVERDRLHLPDLHAADHDRRAGLQPAHLVEGDARARARPGRGRWRPPPRPRGTRWPRCPRAGRAPTPKSRARGSIALPRPP